MVTIAPALKAGETVSILVKADGEDLLVIDDLQRPQQSDDGRHASTDQGRGFDLPVACPAGTVAFSSSNSILQIEGTLAGSERSGAFSKSHPVIDVAPVTGILNEPGLSAVERVQSYGEIRKRLAEKYALEVYGDLDISPVSNPEIKLAKVESLLGAALPASVRSFFSSEIRLVADGENISDSSFLALDDWRKIPIAELIGHYDVATEAAAVDACLSNMPSTVAPLFRDGIELMMVDSDGIGGVAVTSDGTWFSYHQEVLDEIIVLRRSDDEDSIDDLLVSLALETGLDDFLSELIEIGHFSSQDHATTETQGETLTIDSTDHGGIIQVDFYQTELEGLDAIARSSRQV